ncbi:family 16 glycoside hydrolase [Tundrisphaera lichenicola]|uniref:family 16 glycoside hydrolase n=1 Tax=Tundrisphaera lichenicola TaxID=2029860 RepID=UPI003EB85F13
MSLRSRPRILRDSGLPGSAVAPELGAWQTGDDAQPTSPRGVSSMKCRLAIVILSVAGLAGPVLAQSAAERGQTAAYVSAFQNPDGGFAAKPGQASSLGSTSSAIRILGYVGGSVPDVPGAIAYVRSCHDPASGGFAPTPGGKPDVVTTAIGLMAISALKLDPKPYEEGANAFLSRNAGTFEEVRMAVAGLEAIRANSLDFPRWSELVKEGQNPDGTFGTGPEKARATGSRVVALLRMGVTLEEPQKGAILAALRQGQRPDGGWSEGDGPSDLGSSYRIMRGFYMLKEKPDLNRLRGYIAGLRQSDGGYAAKPGGPSELSPTYYCSIMSYWARQLDGEPALIETAGFTPLFNGKDLTGWEGDPNLWSARDGVLVGESPGIKENNFLATDASYADFILQYSVRLTDNVGNSGVQFRSVRVPGHEMSGYQADIGEGYWGCLYDESRRNRILTQANPKAIEGLHLGDWNHVMVRAMGDHITISLNGVTSVDYRETDSGISCEGRIAVQIHAGGPMKVEFKDVLIQPLPIAKVDDQPNAPGFHLRTVKTPSGDRKYSVYVPTGYDGSKEYPAVLFLHGSGERGDDGIQGGQIGLGAAILAHPDRFPAIVVLPQASKTWAADSDDAKAALAALDDVQAAYKVDKSRVVLTGLSMGGAGTWSIAAAHPDRFAALVPICGRGEPEDASKIKGLPTWVVVGDRDRIETVRNARDMVAALRPAGGDVRYTEYREVGHNSWDRAYDDPALIGWMLQQQRKP